MKTPRHAATQPTIEQAEPTDQELVVRALDMYANWIQTGTPLLSASDARAMGKLQLVHVINSCQQNLVVRLRVLAAEMATRNRPAWRLLIKEFYENSAAR